MIKVTPLQDRVVVLRDKPREKSEGGIILPDGVQKKDKASVGQVIAVGPGVMDGGKLRPVALKKGDRVLFSAYAGSDYTLGDSKKTEVEVTVLDERDVLVKLG